MANQAKYFDPMMEQAREAIQQGQQDVVGFMQGIAQRQGHLGAMRMAAQASAPFARQIGIAGAQAAGQAAQLARREEEFNQKASQWQKDFEQRKAQYEQEYELRKMQHEQRVSEADRAARMQALQYTGFNPMIMQDLGYDTMKYPQPDPRGYMGNINQSMGMPYADMGYGTGMQGSFGGGYMGSGMSTMKYQPGQVAQRPGGGSLSPSELFWMKQQGGYGPQWQKPGTFGP